MELTPEQHAIINSTGNIKINAVAGSGKTTTIIEYAGTRPKNSKILYLAFNKSVKLEAVKRFANKGLKNVKVETAHSLAYNYIVYDNGYKVRPNGYKTNEIAELLGLKGNGESLAEFILANHVNKFFSYFCNSDKQTVKDLNYLDIVSDDKARAFVTKYYNYIQKKTAFLFNKMDKGEIEITHDFYLKKYQLSNPKLNYDYILFDEGQDASPAMLDVFLKQKATKVIVGDAFQQIYSWRYAINSLEKTNFKTYQLTTSFRFSQDIANLAKAILGWKKHIGEYNDTNITGLGNNKGSNIKAVLARTNLGLLSKAIEYVNEKKKADKIYFEGNINSYTYADDGTSLYDVLNLYNGKHHLIKDKLIRSMTDIDDLKDYIEKTGEMQLGIMIKIISKYENKIPDIIKEMKEKHVVDGDKDKAQLIFSTVHRCKGMEYDEIQLVNDFVTEQKVKEQDINIPKINEEINLLYVAITRTKNTIHIPETLVPYDHPYSPQIRKMKVQKDDEKQEVPKTIHEKPKTTYRIPTKGKAWSVEDVRKTYQDAYKPWTKEQDKKLEVMYREGVHIWDIAKYFSRKRGAIASRIKKLRLEEKYG